MVAFCDKDWSIGSSFDWSPDITNTVVKIDPNDQTDILVTSGFTFDAEAAEINNTGYWFTLEHNARKASNQEEYEDLNVVSQYSNLPGVTYDKDDDDGDDYWEESEAIVSTREITANKAYVASSEYEKSANLNTGAFLTIAQRSLLLFEYQAFHYDLLNSYVWDSSNIYRLTANKSTSQVNSGIEATQPEAVEILFIEHKSIDSLNNMVAKQKESYYAALSNLPATYSDAEETATTTTATVTFNGPISVQDLAELLESSGATLLSYQAKFVDEDETWCTLTSAILDEATILAKASKFAEECGIKHDRYEGITSAIVEFDATSGAYDYLTSSPLVYFVDMSEFLWENSEEYDPAVEIIVPNYAWQLEDLS